ncbi:unnamed protein product [Paramecium primaurelia]|uniref:Transmembrane protein n=1 Tax=Paramecium primaurelia TaxID=5886 RepID=A0A8S1P2F8_PARPR|nr:unnamed protein product [Paramecium primaurelia]
MEKWTFLAMYNVSFFLSIRKALNWIRILQFQGFTKIQLHTRRSNQIIPDSQVKSDIENCYNKVLKLVTMLKLMNSQNNNHRRLYTIKFLVYFNKVKLKQDDQNRDCQQRKQINGKYYSYKQIKKRRQLIVVEPESIKLDRSIYKTEFNCLLELFTIPTKIMKENLKTVKQIHFVVLSYLRNKQKKQNSIGLKQPQMKIKNNTFFHFIVYLIYQFVIYLIKGAFGNQDLKGNTLLRKKINEFSYNSAQVLQKRNLPLYLTITFSIFQNGWMRDKIFKVEIA